MPQQQLTSLQLTGLANNFLAISQALGNYRYSNNLGSQITQEQNQTLGNLQWTLLNYADDLYTQSAILIMDNVEQSLATISNVTAQIQSTYKTLLTIQKAINVATSVTTLGAAIMSKNPPAIASAIHGVFDTLKAA